MATYTTIKASIVAIIAGATPSSTRNGMPPRFRHSPLLSEDDSARARDFSLRSFSGGTRSSDPAGARRTFSDFDLMIGYPSSTESSALDDVINEDYQTIRNALMDTSNWLGDLYAIGEGDGEEMLPFSVEFDENGVWATIRFSADYSTPA